MLQGKTAVVTGASRGIGRQIALKLASLGANIAAVYASGAQEAEQVCASCRAAGGGRAASYRCDVASFEEVKEMMERIRADFGTVHILVNNAGITRDGLAVSMREADFDAVLDVNLKGAFHMIRHTLPLFLKNKEGCILNISSVSGILGNAGQSNYAASKAGLIGLTRSIAREYAARNIRCNAIAPGYIRTDMTKGLNEEAVLSQIPLGRMGTPEDVAQAAAFLIQAPYITGEVLKVDGGAAM